jgi:2-polyprenyl-6-methoxyphenol hydroxylase-like FAD-dependent oxidoreductase
MRARYLVGCDGAHSMVRKHAGIGFPGFTSDQIALIARVTIPAARVVRKGDGLEISGVGRFAAMRPNQLPGGLFTIAPQDVLDPTAPGDQYLISTHEPRGESDPSDAVSVEELRESLLRVLGADLPFSEATAIRSIVGNSRQADAYRRGRVFLAGDAAHIFNAGGSALNVGLQDAFELARCLAAAVRDRAPEAAIAGYEAARRPAGKRALQLTRAQAALSRDDANGRAVREVIGELVSSRSGARRLARLIEGA